MLSLTDVANSIFETFKNRLSCNSFGEIWSTDSYKKLNLGKYDLTCSVNTDGVSVFNSNTLSLWPILYTINEIPYSLRRKCVCVAGIWFGKGKPNFNSYMQPLVSLFQELSTTGFVWNFAKKSYEYKLYLLNVISNSMARCSIQGLQQHNGTHGCNCCLQKTASVQNVHGKRVYIPQFPLAKPRTHEHYLQCLRNDDQTSGVLKRSCLANIQYFDMINGFPIDYMHCVCLGVVRRLTFEWFDSKNHALEFYCKTQITVVQENLRKVKVPHELLRTVRSITQMSHWKANEWRTFLFIAPTVLANVLPDNYINHFSLLSSAMFILLQKNIPIDKLKKAE